MDPAGCEQSSCLPIPILHMAHGFLAAGLPARVAIALFQVKATFPRQGSLLLLRCPGPTRAGQGSYVLMAPASPRNRAEGALLETLAILSW